MLTLRILDAMNLHSITDAAIAELIGSRLQALRLKSNISQDQIAQQVGISRQTLYQLLTHGKGTISNLVAVLRTLGELDQLSALVTEVRPSPLAIVKMAGKKRTRATGSRVENASLSARSSHEGKKNKDTSW